MGCGASVNQVHAADENGVISKTGKKKSHEAGTGRRSHGRGDSAASKISQHSGDSGFDDEEELHRQRESALLG